MTQETLKLALEALERCVATCFDQRSHDEVMGRPEHFVNRAITAIKEALAQRTWVGLTDEEISELIRATHNTGSFVRAIEAKLKENNHDMG